MLCRSGRSWDYKLVNSTLYVREGSNCVTLTACAGEGSNAGPTVSRSWSILSVTPSHCGLVAKIEAAENDAGRSSFELSRLEFAGRALFDLVAQPQELFVALIRLSLHATLQIVHRRTADGAGYFPATMHHAKPHHHPVMVKASEVAAR